MKEERCTFFDFETKTLFTKMFVRISREARLPSCVITGRNKNHHLTHPDVKKYFIICFLLNGLITKRKKEQNRVIDLLCSC